MSEYKYCMAPFTGQWFFTPISRPLTSYSEVSRIQYMVSILFACAKITRFQWHSEVQLSKIEDIFENDLTYKWGAPKAQWVRLVTNLEILSPVNINHNYFNNKKIKKKMIFINYLSEQYVLYLVEPLGTGIQMWWWPQWC